MYSPLILAACLPTVLGSAAPAPPDFSFEDLWSMQHNFLDNFLYPANVEQINATDKSVFAENVQGRVDITGTFDGRELNNEYVFGIFSQPERFGLFGAPLNYSITQFVGNENIASSTAVISFNMTSFGGVVYPVTLDTWFAFGPDRKIIQYDATFRWFDYFFQTLVEAAGKLFHISDPEQIQAKIAEMLAQKICKTHEDSCLGSDKQYGSQDECHNFLTKEIRFGKPYELRRNTLLCREVHEHMVSFRPKEHCPHIGPGGGGYCVDDMDYTQTVEQRYFRQSWVPYGHAEGNMWTVE
ncbi:hypothetical protein BDW42DRAFT_160883 [Aspergillus taichungensis]|uniref:Uncharacterized protein n=1 Tax=Aspergillus taichungensis TaxID=482145 RepID=A0A2J5I5T7_9EURO|nr:hypothetical protein BDW42DRAFT_160883 [Aspergillus taichungensis]